MTSAIYEISVKQADGSVKSLGDYAGKVLLIVNVASKCGLTPQYEGLEALHRTYSGRGFMVLGFPSNDFADQEPGTDAEIQEFCRTNYGVGFPVFSKISVLGEEAHPLYKLLKSTWPRAVFMPEGRHAKRFAEREHSGTAAEVGWNFEKFLVDRQGNVVGRFGSDIPPQDEMIVKAIEAHL